MRASWDHPLSRQHYKALAFLWLAGAGMRIPLLAVPPVLPLLASDLRMSGTEIGLLNGLPVMLFAVAALPGSAAIARLGALQTLLLGLLIAGAFGALRAESHSAAFLYAMTMLMGAGIAIAQPALPTLVRAWLPTQINLGTAAISNGMVLGPMAPVALTVILLPLVGGWPGALAFWSLPLVLIAGALFLAAPRTSPPQASGPAHAPRKWSNSLVWRLGLMFAGTNSGYFCVNAFLPGYLASAGRPDLISPALAAFNLGQLPATILIAAAGRRLERRIWPYMGAAMMVIVLLLALVSGASEWTIVWAAWLGFFNCTSLVFALAFPALLAAPADIPRLSAGMFTISYSCAMAIAVASGAAWDLSGDARFAFLPIGASVLGMIFLAPTMPFRRLA
jgi:MFS transporter, CP family, cyanate transporter